MLIFTPTQLIQGMISDEDERFEYSENVKPEGKVETWLNKVESEMVNSLKKTVQRRYLVLFQEEKM